MIELTLSMNGNALKYAVQNYTILNKFDEAKTFSHADLNDGNWHHIALVSDQGQTNYYKVTTVLYVDGNKTDVVVESGENTDAGIKFVLGGEMDRYFNIINGANMTIDNFRVYDTRLLSDDEIKAIYEFER